MIVLESNQNHATIKDTEICPTLSASMGMGGGYVPMIIQKVSVMQKVTGTLSPGGHCGSYNGQDAYNDMLVTDECKVRRERSASSSGTDGYGRSVELYARSTGNPHRGGACNGTEC